MCEKAIENQHKDFKFDEFCKGCGNVIKNMDIIVDAQKNVWKK